MFIDDMILFHSLLTIFCLLKARALSGPKRNLVYFFPVSSPLLSSACKLVGFNPYRDSSVDPSPNKNLHCLKAEGCLFNDMYSNHSAIMLSGSINTTWMKIQQLNILFKSCCDLNKKCGPQTHIFEHWVLS